MIKTIEQNRYILGSVMWVLMVCLGGLPLFANKNQTVIHGVVEGGEDLPLEYALVYTESAESVSYTDEKGQFCLEVVPGNHLLQVQLLGYDKYEKPIQVFPGDNRIDTIQLAQHTHNLKELVVRGKNVKNKMETKGFAVGVIETQKASLQSVQTNELLDRTAGVRIRQDGGMGSKVNYNINGLSGNSIKTFIDGTPSSNYGPSFSLSSIPPALIERIEVYKGVVPGYLSEDVLGGAINVVLKLRRKKSLTTSYSGGSFNTHQWNASGSYRWDNGLTVDGSAFYNYSDNSYKVWGKDITFTDTVTWQKVDSKGRKVKRFHDAYQSFGGKFTIGFTNVSWADQFLLGAVLSQTYSEMQNGATMKVVYGDRHSRRKSDVFTLDYSKKDLFLKGLSLKVNASYSLLQRQVIDSVSVMYDWLGPIIKEGEYLYHWYGGEIGAEAGGAKTATIDKDYAAMVRGSLHYRLNENHAFFVNSIFNDFQRKVSDKFKPAALEVLANTRDLQKNIIAVTYENIAFSGRLRTNIFYKHYFQNVVSNEPKSENNEIIVNKYAKNINHNGFGATFSFGLLSDFYLLASAEKALRLPSANELFGNGSDNSLASLGLKPERSLNTNVGFTYTLKLKSHLFKLNSSVYLRDTRDMIHQTLNGPYSFSYAENLESVFTRGIDAEFAYSYADQVDFRFNISKFDMLFNAEFDASGNPYNYYRMQLKNEPSFKFNGQVTYSINNLLQKNARTSIYANISYVNGFYRFWSNVGSNNQDFIPRQYPLDIGITYTLPNDKWVLSLDAKNIFNQQVFDNFGLQKPGRAFYGKITYRIF